MVSNTKLMQDNIKYRSATRSAVLESKPSDPVVQANAAQVVGLVQPRTLER